MMQTTKRKQEKRQSFINLLILPPNTQLINNQRGQFEYNMFSGNYPGGKTADNLYSVTEIDINTRELH